MLIKLILHGNSFLSESVQDHGDNEIYEYLLYILHILYIILYIYIIYIYQPIIMKYISTYYTYVIHILYLYKLNILRSFMHY